MFVLHIGAKKAGSSSIQTFLSANEDILRRHSVEYPQIGRAGTRSHRNLGLELLSARREKFGPEGQDKFDPEAGTLCQLIDDWRRQKFRTLILSTEMLEDAEPDEIEKLKQVLPSERLGKCKIVFVIRNLIDLIPSVYSQQSRHGFHERSFDEFFEKIIKHPRTDFFYTAESWANVFGWSSMEIRALEPRDLKNGDLLDEFVSIIEADPISNQLVKTENRNVSPGWKSLEAVRGLFRGCHGLPEEHPLLAVRERSREGKLLAKAAMQVAAKRGWDRDRGRYLTDEQAWRCIQRFRTAVKRINKRVVRKLPPPVSLKKRPFVAREFEPDVSEISPADLCSFYDEVWQVIAQKSEKGVPDTNGRVGTKLISFS